MNTLIGLTSSEQPHSTCWKTAIAIAFERIKSRRSNEEERKIERTPKTGSGREIEGDRETEIATEPETGEESETAIEEETEPEGERVKESVRLAVRERLKRVRSERVKDVKLGRESRTDSRVKF